MAHFLLRHSSVQFDCCRPIRPVRLNEEDSDNAKQHLSCHRYSFRRRWILYYFDLPRSLIRQGYRLLGQTGYNDASVISVPSEQPVKVPRKLSAMEEARDFVEKKLKEHKVVVFSKSYCPYCKKAKNVLSKYSISPEDYDVTELDKMDESKAAAIQDYMGTLTGAKSVPRVFINGKFIGGGDDTERLDSAGKLQEMLTAAGVH